MTQLKLFEELSETDLLREELKEVRQRSENVRRGLFQRHNQICKMYYEMKDELDALKTLYFKRFPEDNAIAPQIMIKDESYEK